MCRYEQPEARPALPHPETRDDRVQGLGILAETVIRHCIREGLHHRDMTYVGGLITLRIEALRAGEDVDAAAG